MVARTGGDWPVFELRTPTKLLRKSLHSVRGQAAQADEASAKLVENAPEADNPQQIVTLNDSSQVVHSTGIMSSQAKPTPNCPFHYHSEASDQPKQ
jgi:hypothetical protein